MSSRPPLPPGTHLNLTPAGVQHAVSASERKQPGERNRSPSPTPARSISKSGKAGEAMLPVRGRRSSTGSSRSEHTSENADDMLLVENPAEGKLERFERTSDAKLRRGNLPSPSMNASSQGQGPLSKRARSESPALGSTNVVKKLVDDEGFRSEVLRGGSDPQSRPAETRPEDASLALLHLEHQIISAAPPQMSTRLHLKTGSPRVVMGTGAANKMIPSPLGLTASKTPKGSLKGGGASPLPLAQASIASMLNTVSAPSSNRNAATTDSDKVSEPDTISEADTNTKTMETALSEDLPDSENPWVVLERLRRDPHNPEFVYMIPYRRDIWTPLNPYHLKVVPHAKCKKRSHYFTLSLHGVTRTDGADTEFIRLEEWKREAFLFDSVIQIPLFRRYLYWKNFKVWKESVKRGKFEHCRRELQRTAFFASPVLLARLQRLREACWELEQCPLFSAECFAERRLTLEEFSAGQEAQREVVLERLQGFWAEAVREMKAAGERVSEEVDSGFLAEEAQRSAELMAQAKRGAAGAGGAALGASGARGLAGSEFKYTQVAGKRLVHRQLYSLMRVGDLMVLSALQAMVLESSVALCRRFYPQPQPAAPLLPRRSSSPAQGERGESEPLFVVHLVIDERELRIAPGEMEFAIEIEGIVGSFVQTVTSCERLLGHPELEPFYELYEEHVVPDLDTDSLAQIINLNPRYQEVLQELRSACSTAFAAADKLRRTQLPLLEMKLANDEFDVGAEEERAERNKTNFAQYAQMMAKFEAQRETVREIPDSIECGVLEVGCERLKAQVEPACARCAGDIEKMMPRVLAREQRRLLDEIVNANAMLQRPSKTVADFVEFLRFLDEHERRQDALNFEMNEFEHQVEKMEEAGVSFSDEDAVTHSIIFPEYMQMRDNLAMVGSQKEDLLKKWQDVLVEEVLTFRERVGEMRLLAMDPELLQLGMAERKLRMARDLDDQLAALQAGGKQLQTQMRALVLDVDLFPELGELRADVELKHAVWQCARDVDVLLGAFDATAVDGIDVKEEQNKVARWTKVLARADRELPGNPVVPAAADKVQRYREVVQVCSFLTNGALKERHWEQINAACRVRVDVVMRTGDEDGAGMRLQRVVELGLLEQREAMQKVSTRATQEQILEEMLVRVRAKWAEQEFTLKQYKDQKEAFVLGDIEEVQALLDESLVSVSTIMASRYVDGIRSEVEKLDATLQRLQATMDEWLAVQKSWMYLEPIFAAPDIQKQLPSEAKVFAYVHQEFMHIMRRAAENPKCFRVGTAQGQKEVLAQLNEQLDKIQHNLENYLEWKRMAFPRFYFLSNDELLEVLAQTRNVQAVQPFLSGCFDGIKTLDFGGQHPASPMRFADPRSVDIFGMISAEGEYVLLGNHLKARGEVQDWLGAVEKRMVEQLRVLAREALQDYVHAARSQWLHRHAGQLVIMASQIEWCAAVESALDALQRAAGGGEEEGDGGAMEQLLQRQVAQLEKQSALTQGEITVVQRKQLVSLITIDVHNRDILEALVEAATASAEDFLWQMRLRYYWNEHLGTNGDCQVRQLTAELTYSYEYLGASDRLVITALTDRCYMTLIGALEQTLGGAPAGPAGTGKTETTKDLAKALGRRCVVFNCGDNLDANFMRKFFKGLTQSGAWACFDEFNRINIEVLSVIAQQIISIQYSLRQHLTEMEFEGKTIKLLSSFAVFVTMNPGYAGRTELPDNLKALFRPMSMMVPDYALVSEVMLFAEGFAEAKMLSRKMVKLFKLLSEQLSQAKHYDFGMRAVKSVLVMAGQCKRASPLESESIVLIRAMCDSNIPKFSSEDLGLFNDIVKDLFPGLHIEHTRPADLESSLVAVLDEGGLQAPRPFVEKALQVSETMRIRFGVLVLGATGTGKTTLLHALGRAMTSLRETGHCEDPEMQRVQIFTLNPKAISMGELYGNYSVASNEWTDGLASTIVRMANHDESADHKWIVFDGPIDAVWIESMNTVLDDNRMLCLPNGERIKLDDTKMRMLFEVDDVLHASPATISRLGIINLPEESLGYMAPVTTRLEQILPSSATEDVKDDIRVMMSSTLEKAVSFLRAECTEDIPSLDSNLGLSCCSLLAALCDALIPSDTQLRDSEMFDVLKSSLLFALVWSVGGNLDVKGREKFSAWVRDQVTFVKCPHAGLVYDYYPSSAGQFQPFSLLVKPFRYSNTMTYADMVVPTMDTVRVEFVLDLLFRVNRSGLFVGPSGTGKSVIIGQELQERAQSDKAASFTINMSAQTSSIRTQEMLELRMEKQRRGVFTPPMGKRMLCFVDDVNMPQREAWGAQPPLELLRQLLDTVDHFRPGHGHNPPYAGGGGVYDRKKHTWSDFVDTTIIMACAPPGGGRNHVSPRLFRHVNMVSVTPPNRAVLQHMFQSILEGHIAAFPSEVVTLCKPTVEASIEVYERLVEELLPTPAKSHYTFNLRDLSKVFQGILSVPPSPTSSQRTHVLLWIHESQRVFQDRLIDAEDKEWFDLQLWGLVKRKFGLQWEFTPTFVANKPIFCDLSSAEHLYELVEDNNQLPRILDHLLEDYNVHSKTPMQLVFFPDAVQHVTRLCRILRSPQGNAMLVGLGGSGKQSLARLSAFICGCQCQQLEVTKEYGMPQFREDIKKLFLCAGVECLSVVFLVTDTQIVDDGFLEDINCIINSGDVPNLFPQEERDKIIMDLKEQCATLGLPLGKDDIYGYFVRQVKQHLHVVLSMSPVGDSFRNRCRQFPSLINCCTIDWYLEWPEDALIDVAKRSLETVDLRPPQTSVEDALLNEHRPVTVQEMRHALAQTCVTIHSQVKVLEEQFWLEMRRRFYISPKSYLELLSVYGQLLEEKTRALVDRRDTFRSGMSKMASLTTIIAESKLELDRLRPVLVQKNQATTQLVREVTRDTQQATKVKAHVVQETEEVQARKDTVAAIQADAQKDLDEALPMLEDAIRALNSLTKADIVEVKSFTKPPPLVQVVMEAVCTLLRRDATWESAKRVLGQTDFMDQLMTFDKDNIDSKVLRSLHRYIENPDFQPETVGTVSKAAKGLCMWVRAIDVYAAVAKEVEPKKERLREADDELARAEETLAEKRASLAEVQARVATLEEQLSQAEQDQQEMQAQADLCQARMDRAGRLTAALGEEQAAWSQQEQELTERLERLAGDVLVSAACITYSGPFTAEYRHMLLETALGRCANLGLPVSEGFSLRGTLATDFQVRSWTLCGLPADPLSVDNAVVVMNASRCPLMIDPQGQAAKWIWELLHTEGMRTSNAKDSSLLRIAEICIRNGTPLLIQDVGEELDPALTPILAKQTYNVNDRTLIRIGDSEVDYDPAFRLYLASKLPNPHYLPETCIQTTLINFTVTKEGLEDQLLVDLVRKERPDLESAKDKLVVSMANDSKQLHDLQDKVLQLLRESEGSILDNEPLVNTLQQSKQTSMLIQRRFEEAKGTDAELSAAREQYRTVARRASIIYFVIADLSGVNRMYQYSLEFFKRLYNYCIDVSYGSDEDSDEDKALAQRLEMLLSIVTEQSYKSVCRGLFEAHKTTFSFLLCTAIELTAGLVTPEEWNFFLRGGKPQGRANEENPDPEFLTNDKWLLVRALSECFPEHFKHLPVQIKDNIVPWRHWLNEENPQWTKPPVESEATGQGFSLLLLVRVFHEEKIVRAIPSYVASVMGKKFTESPPMLLKDIYADSTAITPIIFLLSSGSDPTATLFKFAKERGISDRLNSISLGQGQGPLAEKLIAASMPKGDWVCLMNCHLSASWMPSLERVVGSFSSGPTVEIDSNFRLWLTSMPSDSFPVSVLQTGIKITNEPPKGIRANMIGSLQDIGEEEWEASKSPETWKKLLMSLCFFHAVVQERRKYGALGWNVQYEFNTSDLASAKQVLRMSVDRFNTLPWDALSYVTGEINYGGRVTDDLDRKLLTCMLSRFYTPALLDNSHFKFSKSGLYHASQTASYAQAMDYVLALPTVDEPEVFGMHGNASLVFQRRATNQILETILNIQPRVATAKAGQSSQESQVHDHAVALLQRLPQPLTERVRGRSGGSSPQSEANDSTNSFDVVRRQEIARFNLLLGTMRASLGELINAIKGVVVMSASLEAMLSSISKGVVPEVWASKAYPSLKPLSSWVRDLHARVGFFKAWTDRGAAPAVFMLPSFFFPQGLVTATLQNHARTYGIAIDALSFKFNIHSDAPDSSAVAEAPNDGILIEGLWLEAGRWDRKRHKLRAAREGEMLSALPVAHFLPTLTVNLSHGTFSQDAAESARSGSKGSRTPSSSRAGSRPESGGSSVSKASNAVLRSETALPFPCPLYKTSTRQGSLSTTGRSTNYILPVSLPSDEPPDVWVLQGTCLLTMTDD